MTLDLSIEQDPAVSGHASRGNTVPVQIVDVDVHPAPASKAELTQFMPKRWQFIEKAPIGVPYRLDQVNHGARADARPGDEVALGMAGTDPDLFERQLLNEAGVDFAILIYHTSPNLPSPDADAARCSAINEWMASTWLGDYNAHGRYRGSVRLPMQNPKAAIAELDRWADHPYFVQAMTVNNYSPAFGHPMYEPVLRAVSERGLPLAMHTSHWLVTEPSVAGSYNYFFEWHGQAHPMASAPHLAGMVCNGVFERLPDLKFVFVEGGVSWAHTLANRLDKNWRRLRDEVPELKLAPSEYLQRQTYFSTQPTEEPSNRAAVVRLYERMGADRRLMFATDYPHFDYDEPASSLPKMSDGLRRRIMVENACDLYGLPRERPAA